MLSPVAGSIIALLIGYSMRLFCPAFIGESSSFAHSHSSIPPFQSLAIPWFCSPVISILDLICQVRHSDRFCCPRGCCVKLHSIAIMGRSFASLFTSRAPARGFVGPTDRPLNSNNVPETSWARGSSRSKSSRPLINLNAPTNSVGSLVVVAKGYLAQTQLTSHAKAGIPQRSSCEIRMDTYEPQDEGPCAKWTTDSAWFARARSAWGNRVTVLRHHNHAPSSKYCLDYACRSKCFSVFGKYKC